MTLDSFNIPRTASLRPLGRHQANVIVNPPEIKMIRWFKLLLSAVAVSTVLAACSSSNDPTQSIFEIAANDSRFTVLTQSLEATGLDEALSGAGTFTVFAPTDDAFAALLADLGIESLDALLAAVGSEFVADVLKYHVLGAVVPRAQVPLGAPITTLQGETFQINAVGSNLIITDANGRTSKIILTDIRATNGVIHVIDTVILPSLN
jgi:uncharacterized surface protein with fasciclin (FAS1) repeats